MPAVCRREVCKYAQQSKNRALKLSRLDLAGLHRSQTVGMAHFSKPSSLEYACYRQTAKKKYFSRHLLVLARYPTRERTSLPWSCRCWMLYPASSRTCTHLRRDTSNADLSSLLPRGDECTSECDLLSHFSNGRRRRKRRRSLKSSVSFPPPWRREPR